MLKVFHGNRVRKVNSRRNMLLIIVSVLSEIPAMQLLPVGEVGIFVTRDASTIFRYRYQVVVILTNLP
jgi:hypothetical protein